LKLDYARAYNCVGEAYKDWEKEGGPGSTAAREAFQMAVALEPNDKRFQANLGDAYRGAKQYERAIKPYQEAIRLDPKYEAPHHGLGRTYLDLCMVKEATAEYAALKQLKSARADDLLSQIQKKKC
jgi:tetratricopeptide (TPR) repeat protein